MTELKFDAKSFRTQKMQGELEVEVEIWNECTRLIALIIIAYIICILTELYEIKLQ